MWLWLRKKLPKSFLLWSKLTGYVGALHLAVLFGLFFVYKGENHTLSFTLNRHIDLNAAVVFLPLQKRAVMLNAPAAGEKATPVAEQSAIKKTEEKEKVLKPSNAKKEKSATALASVMPKKKAKAANKKALKKIQDKKTSPEILAQKDTPKKEEPKPEQELKKPEIEKQEQSILPVAADVANAQVGTENIQYLGQLDLEALQLEQTIQEAVTPHWNRPVGVPKNIVCEMDIIVGWDGVITFNVKKSSNIAMYDVAVRGAMMKVIFPKQLWGKNFTLNF